MLYSYESLINFSVVVDDVSFCRQRVRFIYTEWDLIAVSLSIFLSFLPHVQSQHQFQLMQSGPPPASLFSTKHRSDESIHDYKLQHSCGYPFEEYDLAEEQYSGHLALLHKEHMEYLTLGLLSTENFMPETVEDVYKSNLYAMSWFYGAVYPFDSYEAEKELHLYEEAVRKQLEDDANALFTEYEDLL
jgi:hypothetical protein